MVTVLILGVPILLSAATFAYAMLRPIPQPVLSAEISVRTYIQEARKWLDRAEQALDLADL